MCVSNAFCIKYGSVIARVLLSALFVISGLFMAMNFSGTAAQFTQMGLPIASVVVALTVLVKILGGMMVLTGIHAREGAFALAIFTIIATAVAHVSPFDFISVFKNLAIVGGLLMISTHGAGAYSLGHICKCPACQAPKA